MGLVKDWFYPFVERHKHRFPNPGGVEWPTPGTDGHREFFRGWMECFIQHKVREDEADAASIRLQGAPSAPAFPQQHLPALVLMLGTIRDEARVQGHLPPSGFDQAMQDSAGCPDCGGGGVAYRYRHQGPEAGRRLGFWCLCPLGRYQLAFWKRADPHHRRLDLAEHLFLRVGPVPWFDLPDSKYCYPPDRVPESPAPRPRPYTPVPRPGRIGWSDRPSHPPDRATTDPGRFQDHPAAPPSRPIPTVPDFDEERPF